MQRMIQTRNHFIADDQIQRVSFIRDKDGEISDATVVLYGCESNVMFLGSRDAQELHDALEALHADPEGPLGSDADADLPADYKARLLAHVEDAVLTFGLVNGIPGGLLVDKLIGETIDLDWPAKLLPDVSAKAFRESMTEALKDHKAIQDEIDRMQATGGLIPNKRLTLNAVLNNAHPMMKALGDIFGMDLTPVPDDAPGLAESESAEVMFYHWTATCFYVSDISGRDSEYMIREIAATEDEARHRFELRVPKCRVANIRCGDIAFSSKL